MTRRILIVGGGHNGLVCAAYLARAGRSVTLLERRELLGGACVTEALWPGYRVSRAAYVLSLFRPAIARELELERHGLAAPAALAGVDHAASRRARARARCGRGARRRRDRALLEARCRALARRSSAGSSDVAAAIEPLLDDAPPAFVGTRAAQSSRAGLGSAARACGSARDIPETLRLLVGPARALLEEHFESEPLRATLATDAIIGAFASPSMPGTGYVLFHHVMGTLGGQRGVWAYVEGGMGRALGRARRRPRARRARSCAPTRRSSAIRCRDGRARGVALASGETLDADLVVSGMDLARTAALVDDAGARRAHSRAPTTRSPVVKLNLALGALPRFRVRDRDSLPLGGTIHVGPVDLDGIERAFGDAAAGRVSELPVVELTLPSVARPDARAAGQARRVDLRAVRAGAARRRSALAEPARRDARPRARRDRGARARLHARRSSSIEVLAAPELERDLRAHGREHLPRRDDAGSPAVPAPERAARALSHDRSTGCGCAARRHIPVAA